MDPPSRFSKKRVNKSAIKSKKVNPPPEFRQTLYTLSPEIWQKPSYPPPGFSNHLSLV